MRSVGFRIPRSGPTVDRRGAGVFSSTGTLTASHAQPVLNLNRLWPRMIVFEENGSTTLLRSSVVDPDPHIVKNKGKKDSTGSQKFRVLIRNIFTFFIRDITTKHLMSIILRRNKKPPSQHHCLEQHCFNYEVSELLNKRNINGNHDSILPHNNSMQEMATELTNKKTEERNLY